MIHHASIAVFALAVTASSTYAIEEDPVSKAQLAIGEANFTLQLIAERTESDSKLDSMCLRLGRFSAILKRIRGSTPAPPSVVTEKYSHYESFCGWGKSDVIGRGASDPGAIDILRSHLITDKTVLQKYVDENLIP